MLARSYLACSLLLALGLPAIAEADAGDFASPEEVAAAFAKHGA